MPGPRPFLRSFHLPPKLHRSLRNPAVLATVCWALVVGLAYAADCVLLREIEGPNPNGAFGSSIALIGTINADSASDIAVGAPGRPGLAIPEIGTAYVVSPTGQFLLQLHCEMPSLGDRCGEAIVGVGDWTGDGVPEIAVGAPLSDGATDGTLRDIGRVNVFSGFDGSLVRDIPGPRELSRFGSRLVAADLDRDGLLDLVIGAPGFGRPGEPAVGAVFALSATGAPLVELQGEAAGDRFGAAIDVAIGCDSCSDAELIYVGATGADSNTDPFNPLVDAGAVYVFQTPDDAAMPPTLRYVWHGDSSSEDMGSDLRVGWNDPDANTDPIIIVGSRRYGVPGLPDIGRVSGYSNATGLRVWVKDGTVPGGNFGWSVATLSDLTNDAVSDWSGASPGVDGGAVGLSGQVTISQGGKSDGGQVLCAPTGFQPGELFGFAVAPIGDLDGDGLGEFAVGAPGYARGPVAPTGAVRIFGVAAGPPPGRPTVINADAVTERSEYLVEFEPSPDCAAVDFAAYSGRLSIIGDSSSEYTPLRCSTGGAHSVSVPLPDIPVGTAAFVLMTSVMGNEEGAVSSPAPRTTCQVFINPQPCR